MSEIEHILSKLLTSIEHLDHATNEEKEKLVTVLQTKDKVTVWNNGDFARSFFNNDPKNSEYPWYLGQYMGLLLREDQKRQV